MTREMDHTRALMEFVRLVFQVNSVREFQGSLRKTIYHSKIIRNQVRYEYQKGDVQIHEKNKSQKASFILE